MYITTIHSFSMQALLDEQYKAKVERMIHLKKGKKIEKEMSFVEYHI